MSTVDVSTTMSPGAAARELGISKQYLFRLVETGRLSATMTPIGRLFDRGEVARLAQERRDAVRAAA